VRTSTEVLQALLDDLTGETQAERTARDKKVRVLNALLEDLTGSTNDG
jgi:hypothetical protein